MYRITKNLTIGAAIVFAIVLLSGVLCRGMLPSQVALAQGADGQTTFVGSPDWMFGRMGVIGLVAGGLSGVGLLLARPRSAIAAVETAALGRLLLPLGASVFAGGAVLVGGMLLTWSGIVAVRYSSLSYAVLALHLAGWCGGLIWNFQTRRVLNPSG